MSQAAHDRLMDIMQSKLGERRSEFLIPPPVFLAMEGEFVDFDEVEGWLETRFSIKASYRNPYHTMQGGMIAAAIDNTLGPLSMLVASPNVTRTLDIINRHLNTLPSVRQKSQKKSQIKKGFTDIYF